MLLAGCSVGPDFRKPSVWSPVSWFAGKPKPPPDPLASLPVPEPVNPNWWNLFHDRELTTLENRVGASNLNIRLATIRLAESRSQLRITEADQLPNVDGNASYQRSRLSLRGEYAALLGPIGSIGGEAAESAATLGFPVGPTGFPNNSFNLWQYGFDASWELDLWGRVRREVEAAHATLAASAEDRRNALLSVLAEVARDYIELRGIQTQIAITRQNLATAQQTQQLTEDRYRGGLTTDLDVENATAQVQQTRSQLPNLAQQQDEMINALSFLLGEAPGALRAELITPEPVPPVPPRVPVGVPSELVLRRPDVREAEAQLHAATADVGVAIGNFYPRFTMNGTLDIQAIRFTDLGNWDSRQYNFGPSISLPIFEGGRLRGELQLRKAEQREAAINYQRTVLQAWHDVDNALTAYAAEQRRRDSLIQAVAANERALDLARQRYTQGVADFLNVLDVERTLLATQQQLANSTATVSTNLVQLYKALGGGWEAMLPVEPGVD